MKQILAEIAFLLFLSDVLSISDLFHHSNDLALDHEFVLPHSSAVVKKLSIHRALKNCKDNVRPMARS